MYFDQPSQAGFRVIPIDDYSMKTPNPSDFLDTQILSYNPNFVEKSRFLWSDKVTRLSIPSAPQNRFNAKGKSLDIANITTSAPKSDASLLNT